MKSENTRFWTTEEVDCRTDRLEQIYLCGQNMKGINVCLA